MSLPANFEGSSAPDYDAMDSPAERLAERYKVVGMSEALARQLVQNHGADAFGVVEHYGTAEMPPELADGWRMTAFCIWEAPLSRLSAGTFLMAAGWLPPGITSQRDMARLFKVTVEHVSNLVEEWQKKLNLPRTEHQKSAKAIESARTHHKKNRKHHVRK